MARIKKNYSLYKIYTFLTCKTFLPLKLFWRNLETILIIPFTLAKL